MARRYVMASHQYRKLDGAREGERVIRYRDTLQRAV